MLLAALLLLVAQQKTGVVLPLWLQVAVLAFCMCVSLSLYYGGGARRPIWLLDMSFCLLLGSAYGLAPLCAATLLAAGLYELIGVLAPSSRDILAGCRGRVLLGLFLFLLLLIAMDILAVNFLYPRMGWSYLEQFLVCLAIKGGGQVLFFPMLGGGDYAVGGLLFLLLRMRVLSVFLAYAVATKMVEFLPETVAVPFLAFLIPPMFLLYLLEGRVGRG